jgi:hypothetical protein
MQVQIRDSAAFRRISPAMLRAYLETKEWIRQEIWRDSIAVWAWEHNGEVQEILVPLQEWSRRYAVRISEVVETLSEVEQRSQLDVFYDLIGAGADVIRLQSLNGYGESSLSLDDSANLLDYSRNLLAASARAAERPGLPVYRGGVSGEVQGTCGKFILCRDMGQDMNVLYIPGYRLATEFRLIWVIPSERPLLVALLSP